MQVPAVRNYIGGRWADSSSGQLLEHHDPADLTRITCRFQRSSHDDAKQAIQAALIAQPQWASMPVAKRAAILTKVLQAIIRRRDELAQVLTEENGKTLAESLGEIDAAIKEMDWQIAEGRRLYGDTVPSEREGVFAYSIRQPLGVVSVISPWNFPFNVPCRKCTPALVTGNAVVFKPASLTPRTGMCFVEAYEEAGLPAGVLNMVTGDGSTVGDELVTNPDIKAISFTGSTPVGIGIQKKAAETLARTQLEMGGKNPVVVLADADLGEAADGTVLAACACAGQWCTSTSRAVVEESVYDEFVEKVVERVGRIKVGHGLDSQSTMGPVCGEAQRSDILRYIEIGKKEGARLVTGGSQITSNGMDRGCFIEPTVFADVTPDMTIAKEEIFGPVLAIIKVADFDEAIAAANDVEFGLSSAIYTRSISRALAFVEQTEVGLTHVNIPSAHKEPQMSFGGIKHSGTGLPEAGKTGIEFFTRHKVVYIKYQ
jgi:alpha-ketoglutaric semialdehyde dehydrogenase